MTDEYTFETNAEDIGEARLTWSKNGVVDPLNFWVVPNALVEAAKEHVRTGAFDNDVEGIRA
jgi:hypothetical protein